jgi:hypothetical protein
LTGLSNKFEPSIVFDPFKFDGTEVWLYVDNKTSLVVSDLMYCSFDIGGIVEHHSLSFLFITEVNPGSNTMDGSNLFESPVNFPYISKLNPLSLEHRYLEQSNSINGPVNIKITLLCRTPRSTVFQLYRGVNQSVQWKPCTCCKSLTNLIT